VGQGQGSGAWRETEAPRPGVFFRRTVGGEKVEILIEWGRRLLPIEVKTSSAPRAADARASDTFCAEFPERAPFGLVLHAGTDAYPLGRRLLAVPLGSVL
jgi:hypothetical protein